MTNPLQSTTSSCEREDRPSLPNWVKVGALAAGSAFVGGLTAAWFYRKTVKTLHDAAAEAPYSNFGIEKAHADEDT